LSLAIAVGGLDEGAIGVGLARWRAAEDRLMSAPNSDRSPSMPSTYLDSAMALAVAQARLKIIPPEACDEIVRHCDVKEYDFAKLKEATERIGYPVLPVVQQLVKLCKDKLGEWSHWGATTQ